MKQIHEKLPGLASWLLHRPGYVHACCVALLLVAFAFDLRQPELPIGHTCDISAPSQRSQRYGQVHLLNPIEVFEFGLAWWSMFILIFL